MRRAIPSPGPLWRGLRIFCLAPPLTGVSPFLHQELSLVVVISFHPVLRALLHSFRVSSPSRAVRSPWALAVLLYHVPSSSFASLRSTTLRSLVKMVLFFVALATAFPIDELQALSRYFSFVRGEACLSFVLTFVAMCESLLVPSLAPSWLYRRPTLRLVSTYICPLLCPVCALCIFLDRTASMHYCPCCLFVSALPVSGSFCGRGFVPPPGGVHAASAARLEVSPVRTHEFSGISSSVAFLSDGRLLCLFSMFPLFLCFVRVPA